MQCLTTHNTQCTSAADALPLVAQWKNISKAVTLKGSQLTWSMMHQFKLVERRKRSLGLQTGWYALHTGLGDIDECNRINLEKEIKGLPTSSSLDSLRGKIVGAFHVFCKVSGASVRAKERVCYLVDAVMKIDKPIECSGKLWCWKLPPSVKSNLVDQLKKSEIRFNNINNLFM